MILRHDVVKKDFIREIENKNYFALTKIKVK